MAEASISDERAGYSQFFNSWIPPPPTSLPYVYGQFDDEEEEERKAKNGPEQWDDGWESSEKEQEQNNNEYGDEINEDYYYDDDEYWDLNERCGPNSQVNQKQLQTSDELFRKFSSKISVEKYEGMENLPTGVGNKILANSKKAISAGMKTKDKQDRATVEQVLDPRTRMILYKLLSTGKIVSIDGCISTGKEANVYHATGPENNALAIKIYKTSILTFKSRDKYVSGEFRFRQGYCKKNPRKMVRVWAEKEFRNLLRIHSCGSIKVPHPKILKSHVLVMDFIGENGWPCPLLKDVKFQELDLADKEQEVDEVSNSEHPVSKLLSDLYRQCLIILYKLFKHCKLVHADFSEFNLILRDYKELFVIDVSQSVEHDHPRSLDFLKHDIKNVQEFFGKYILVGDYKDIFEFITSPTVDDSNYEAVLEDIISRAKKLESFNVADEVFRQTHIPRKMQEIVDYEQDYEKMKKGEKELVYPKIMGMKSDMSGPEVLTSSKTVSFSSDVIEDQIEQLTLENSNSCTQKNGTEEKNSAGESEESSSESDDEQGSLESKGSAGRPKNESLEEKRLRKKQVKEEKAEKRKSKVKKHVKKRKEKLTHPNSKR